MIAVIIIIVPIYWRWKSGNDFVLDSTMAIFFGGILLVMNIPSILLYLSFYFENKNTSFSLHHKSKTITITENGTTRTYSQSDVEESTYHLGIYYKNAIDRAGRVPMLNSDFGYWDLKFKNGDRYFLTNILHDLIHYIPFYDTTKYRFRMYTYINRSDSNKAKDLEGMIEDSRDKTLIERYVERYQSKPESELNQMLNNKSDYQKEAIEAVKIVLKNKNVR